VEEEKVVRDLLAQAQAKAQSYVLGIKSQAGQPRSETPLIDQGLIDSLLANDSNNFLVRRALESGLQVRRIQSEKAQVMELRASINSFIKTDAGDQTVLISQIQKSLANLEVAYNDLIGNIRKTFADYAHQQYGDAVRITDETRSDSTLRPILVPSIVGLFLGFAAGAGLSLLGVYIGRSKPAVA
jgi:DNA-directed RNA polymerase beta subunit